MREHANNFAPALTGILGTLAADSTEVAVDLQGYDSALISLNIGAGGITFSGSNKVEFKLTHSDDNSTYVAVEDRDVVLGAGMDASVGTGGIIKSLVAAHATPTAYKAAYIGEKRYLKLLADFSGTHGTGTAMSAVVLRGNAHRKPA